MPNSRGPSPDDVLITAQVTTRELTLLTALRTRYPNAKLTVVTRDGGISHVDNIVSHDDLRDIQAKVLDSLRTGRATIKA